MGMASYFSSFLWKGLVPFLLVGSIQALNTISNDPPEFTIPGILNIQEYFLYSSYIYRPQQDRSICFLPTHFYVVKLHIETVKTWQN